MFALKSEKKKLARERRKRKWEKITNEIVRFVIHSFSQMLTMLMSTCGKWNNEMICATICSTLRNWKCSITAALPLAMKQLLEMHFRFFGLFDERKLVKIKMHFHLNLQMIISLFIREFFSLVVVSVLLFWEMKIWN